MRRGGRVCASTLPLVLLLLVLATLSDWSAANAIRRSSSFVVPTSGSAHSLTLTTYVTDAAELHYAAVVAGHAPLEAAAIKSASQQCADVTTLAHQGDAATQTQDSIVQASTVAVDRAQKVERLLSGLQANTSYDVYFVAEVPNSNGVFGSVLSVLGTVTNPTAPTVEEVTMTAANGSATAVAVNVTLGSPGIAHFAFVPSGQDDLDRLTADDVITRSSRDLAAVVFAAESRFRWDLLLVLITVEDLLPATEYDVLIVTEALGHGAVFSTLRRQERAVVTHASAPDVMGATCSSTKASSTSFDISFRLQFAPQDFARATPTVFDGLQYHLHYEVVSESTNGTTASAHQGLFPVVELGNVEDLLQNAVNTEHKHSVEGLAPGVEHEMSMRVETVGSNGVFGQTQRIGKCRTHANAPKIVKATVGPVNGSVNALEVEVELERPANIHYIVMPRSIATQLRNVLSRVESAETLVQQLQEGPDGHQLRRGVVEMTEDDSSSSVVKAFVIDELEVNSPYSIVVIPETIGSFGVFAKPYETVLEATTNEEASEVSIVSARPTHGSVSSIDVQVSMTKPADILFACRGNTEDQEECSEVPRDELQRISQSHQASDFAYRIGNLSADQEYDVSLFAESQARNGVRSNHSVANAVRTFRPAPRIVLLKAHAVDARVDALQLHVESNEPGILLFVVTKSKSAGESDNAPVHEDQLLSAQEIVNDLDRHDSHKSGILQDAHTHSSRNAGRDSRRHPPQAEHSQPEWNIVKRGRAVVRGTSLNVLVEDLQSNSSYSIHAVMETGVADEDEGDMVSSGVIGTSICVNSTTHDVAPVIVKATADAASNRTDSVVITANVSRPGIVHYHISDTDFADPATIKHGSSGNSNVQPHEVRGSFSVETTHMAMEIKNGTNDTQPMDPLVFANNFTVEGLREATTYHLSLTTETFESHGVFGEFPAPILVTTHDSPPQFQPHSLFIGPTAGSSTSLSIRFRLDKLGEVHYAIFFRGLVRDRTTDAFEMEEQRRLKEQELAAEAHAKMSEKQNGSSKTVEFVKTPRWPPPSSVYDLSRLTPRAVKDASLEELEDGVWENGTISVSRDDVFKLKLTEKKIDKLPPNGIFDVCLAPETAASDGIFAPLACNRVVTHADYTNQSIALDEISVAPVLGRKDAVRIELLVSKLMEIPDGDTSPDAKYRHLERVAGRVPYFVLIDGHEGRSDFSHNAVAPVSHRPDRTISPFKAAIPGRGNVVAAGMLDTISFENDSFVAVEHIVSGLEENHKYYIFFAYETAQSDGVFTKVNPHKHRPNETTSRHSETPGIEVTTFEQAPRMKRYEAVPTYGNTTAITVKMDIACASREEVILHLIILNDGCPLLPTSALLPSEKDLMTIETGAHHENDPCDYALIYRRVEVNMTERNNEHQHHHQRHHHRSHDAKATSIEEEIFGDGILQPNTTYQVLMATETFNSSGVVSEKFETSRVTTLPLAPRFNKLLVQPRKGSTTELLIIFELEYPGEVHYLLGKSGNPELNVTSPYNVSAKSLPGQRDNNFHDYGRDVVRSRRTIKVGDVSQAHVEVIDYLVAGTSYDVYVVAEMADDSGVYGEVLSFTSVATFATPLMLLAHTAFPTPGTVDSLSVGFRVEEGIPCLVHISVITSSPWALTSRVAYGTDTYGNRLAQDDRFIGRTGVSVEGISNIDADGWREVNVSVPFPGKNYTVFLVTETKGSDGVFGTVASHTHVRAHQEPPMPLNVSVRPADARVDALTVDVGVNHDEGCHVHYAVLRHRQRFSRSAITNVGRVDVVGANTTSFIIEGLQGRTAYDVYLRLETLESGGVMGEWTPFPVTATTHGLPAEVLESVECAVSPTCEAIGRQPCSYMPNVCGDCLDGYDGVSGSSNVACRPLASGEMRPSIIISGVRINPRRRRHNQHEQRDELQEQLSSTEDDQQTEEFKPQSNAAMPNIPIELPMRNREPEFDSGSIVDTADARLCPTHARLVAPGQCECETGFHVDTLASSCVPSYENPLLAQSMALNYASRAF